MFVYLHEAIDERGGLAGIGSIDVLLPVLYFAVSKRRWAEVHRVGPPTGRPPAGRRPAAAPAS